MTKQLVKEAWSLLRAGREQTRPGPAASTALPAGSLRPPPKAASGGRRPSCGRAQPPASMVTLADSPSLSMVPSRPTSAHLYDPTAPPGVSLVALSRTSRGADWRRGGELSRESASSRERARRAARPGGGGGGARGGAGARRAVRWRRRRLRASPRAPQLGGRPRVGEGEAPGLELARPGAPLGRAPGGPGRGGPRRGGCGVREGGGRGAVRGP